MRTKGPQALNDLTALYTDEIRFAPEFFAILPLRPLQMAR